MSFSDRPRLFCFSSVISYLDSFCWKFFFLEKCFLLILFSSLFHPFFILFSSLFHPFFIPFSMRDHFVLVKRPMTIGMNKTKNNRGPFLEQGAVQKWRQYSILGARTASPPPPRERLFIPNDDRKRDRIERKLQVVYLTFARLWNLARETFALIWPLSEDFILENLVIKSMQKIRFEKIRNRRPHGSSIKHGGFWDHSIRRASVEDQSPDIPFEIGWILGNSIRPV